MTNVFTPVAPILLKTTGGHDFPVARVFCVGRNYAAHAVEMGKDPDRDPPFYFTKFPDAVRNSAPEDDLEIAYPAQTGNFHFEAELVVAIGKSGFEISQDAALDYVCGYAVGLDMTRRDLQLEAREKGRPWDTGKNVPDSCPTGRLHMIEDSGHIADGRIHLTVNGETRQDADISDLIWSVPEIIVHLSTLYPLRPGDLIYTGTPAGVGAVVSGDEIVCTIAGLPDLKVRIGAPYGQPS